MLIRTVALATTLALSPVAAFADWQIDPSHTAVVFEVEHFGYSDVTGVFPTVEATIDSFDPENLDTAQFKVTLDATALTTFWGPRDEHIKGPDFLDVAKFPEITFVSTSVKTTGDGTADVSGDLTIKDVTKPVTFKATVNKIGESPVMPGTDVAGFTLTGEIDRTAFGVDTYAPAIGAIMPVTINVELNNKS
ncbi:polyisoprenoid-binding protein YceI [Amorphus suaedae]